MRKLLWIVAPALLLGLFLAVRAAAPPAGRASAAPPSASAPGSARGRRPGSTPGRGAALGLAAVRGQVITTAGAPVRRAEVRIFQRQAESDEDAMAEVETDDAGAFEAFVPPSKIRVTATAPGFTPAQARGAAPGAPIVLTLAAGATLRGRVVRAGSGEPVVGAGVGRSTVVLTDGAGRFQLTDLEAGRYRPVARAEGLYGQAPHDVWVDAGETSEEITIVMRPVGSLRGRLDLACTAAPCPGGTVELRSAMDGVLSATADAAGEVLFPALLPDRYSVFLTCPGHAVGEEAPVLEVGEEPLTVGFVAHHRPVITGVLVDEDGAPGGAISVRARRVSEPGEPSMSMSYQSDEEDGRFELGPVPPGTYRVSAAPCPQPVVVTVAEGVALPEIRLQCAIGRVVGRVVDEQGRPLADAQMNVELVGEHDSRAISVDEEGRFEFARPAPGKLRFSVFHRRTRVSLAGDVEVTVPIRRPLTLVATIPEGRIEGRVVGEGPLRGPFTVEADCRDGASESRGSTGEASTDAGGHFSVIVSPTADECRLRAISDRGETAEARGVKAGARVELRVRPPATLRGRVKGAPRAFQVRLRTGREEVFFATDGAWEMDGVPAGETRVEVTVGALEAYADFILAAGEIRAVDLTPAPPEDEGPGEP